MQRIRFVTTDSEQTIVVDVDEDMTVTEIIDCVIQTMKLPRTNVRGEPILYKLAYNKRFLFGEDTLSIARVPDGASIDVISDSAIMGAEQRNPREWEDYEELLELQRLNPNSLEIDVLGYAYDRAPLGYQITFKGFWGPVVDWNTRQGIIAPPEMENAPLELPRLQNRFVARIHMLERYPFVEPQWLFMDPLLAHPHVRVTNRHACLYVKWKPVYTLADAVRRMVTQITYNGFNPKTLAAPDMQIHNLNPGALAWITRYLERYPDSLPLTGSDGEPPLVLTMPKSAAATPKVITEASSNGVIAFQKAAAAPQEVHTFRRQ